jgi:SAM-dependent methyltransferase
MATDLADLVDGTPGRYVPQEMEGELVEAEHLARYWWASGLAAGRRVLDAGCGLGYGSGMLAAGGAKEVTGVDLAEEVVAAARAAVPEARFETGDVRSLPFADDSFDLVVCFEVIEHVADQEATLDELRRVLAPGGALAISSPNREQYVPGNPHHVRELTTAELETLLKARFAEVRLLQQCNFAASSISATGARGRQETIVHRLVEKPMGEETYTLAVAGDGDLPASPDLLTLAAPIEIREWVELFRAQQAYIEQQADALATRLEADRDRVALLRRLTEAETALAELPGLRARAEEADRASRRAEQLAWELDRARRVIADLQSSLSWRVTVPLRSAKQLAGRRKG